jgi:hypothetical protein
MYLKIHFYKENCVLKSLVYSSLTEQDISYMQFTMKKVKVISMCNAT